MGDGTNIEDMADAFKALSDPLRLRLLKLLTRHKQHCVCGLAEELGISQPNVSHHLKILKTAGLIRCEKSYGYSYYVVDKQSIGAIYNSLKEEVWKKA